MTSRDFAYWLQGFIELQNPSELSAQQVKMLRAHLNLALRCENIVPEEKEKTEPIKTLDDFRVRPRNDNRIVKC